jgi:hypothetical protein
MTVRAIRTIVVVHPTVFWKLLFMNLPIILLLLTMSIIEIRTTGSSMAFMTWDHMVMAIRGALGIRMIATAIAIINVNRA